jgi:hypothetical protein
MFRPNDFLFNSFGGLRIGSRSDPSSPPYTWPLIHWVAIAALVLRLIVAWRSEKISHPDALFQYLEQAHRVVYGYGFIPWEYRFGTRNWLLPGGLAMLLKILRALGLDCPSAYIPLIKSFVAIISVSVVYANYTIGRHLFSEQTGQFAAIFAAVWYELISSSTFPTPDVLGMCAVLGAFALATLPQTGRRVIAIGILLGLAVALRVQYAPPAAVVAIVVVIRWGWWPALTLSGYGAAVLVGAGLSDAWTWGTPFISYYNNLLFNSVYGISNVFGRHPLYFYIAYLAVMSSGLHLVALASGIVSWRRSWPILLVVASVLVPHMLVAHKEYRFVHLIIPLLLLLLARGSIRLTSRLPVMGTEALSKNLAAALVCAAAGALLLTRSAQLGRHEVRVLVLLGVTLLMAPLIFALFRWLARRTIFHVRTAAILTVGLVSGAGCVATNVLERDDRLLAALDLSKRRDVAAVLDLAGPWWQSGGYYYLHKDVPYYFKENIEKLPASEIPLMVSHVIVRDLDSLPSGFRVSAVFGKVSVLEQEAPPASYSRLPQDGREPKQQGVDDRFAPTVRRSF